MSSAPPPPPPPPDYGHGFARQRADWTRQAAKQQRRAAHLAARQQRDLLRAQRRAQRRTSVVGPLLLVAMGLALFLVQSGHLSLVLAVHWLGVWWPLVLVAAGIVLLGEWAVDTRSSARRDGPSPRRILGPTGVLLLVGIALAGLSISGLHWSSDWARTHWNLPEVWGLDDWLQPQSETVHQLQASLKPGALLTIGNHKGNVTITGSSQDGMVHVTARQHAWAWQKRDLDDRKKQNMPSLASTSSGMRLEVAGEGRDYSDLTIEVPHEASVQIEAEQGEVAVSELRGALSVADHVGNIELTALTGDVRLQVHDDDASISGHSLTGNVSVEGRSGDLTFTDVSGPVTLRGDFFGTTHLERVQGNVHFESSFTKLDCAGIPGDLNVEGRSEMTGRNLNGPVALVTTDREITLTELHKGATIENQKGSVTLSFAQLSDHVGVQTTDGSIKVLLPATEGFRVRAETADGDIHNDFGLKAQTLGHNRVSLLGDIGKGGPLIDLRTKDGDVEVRKTGSGEKKAEEDQ